jgi:hypothetical protein
MKTRTKAIIAAGSAALVVGAAAVILSTPAGTPPAPAPSQAASGTGLHATGKFGFPVSDIKIGDGGTKKGPDGKTPIGYNGTCDSAVQAAANYAPLLRDLNLDTWAVQKKTLQSVTGAPGTWMGYATQGGDLLTSATNLEAAKAKSGSFEGHWINREDVKAGGLYRVASCQEKKKAVVQIFGGGVEARIDQAPAAGYDTASMELSWDGDWKITDALMTVLDPTMGGKLKDAGPLSGGIEGGAVGGAELHAPPLTTAILDQAFQGKSRDGWVEFANAQR